MIPTQYGELLASWLFLQTWRYLALVFCSLFWCGFWPLTSGRKRIHRDQTGDTGPLLFLVFSSCLWSCCFLHKTLDHEAPPHAPAAPLGPGFCFPRAQPLGSMWLTSDVHTLVSSVNRQRQTVGQSPGVWLWSVNRSAGGGPGAPTGDETSWLS